MEIINVRIACNKEAGKRKEISSEYDSKGQEKNPRTSEKKEKTRDGQVCMYECGNHLLYLTYERACVSQQKTISNMKEIVEIFKSEIKERRHKNRDMGDYIDIFS